MLFLNKIYTKIRSINQARKFLGTVINKKIFIAFALSVPCAISAQNINYEFKNKPISIIVPMSPGGSTDIIGRELAKHLGSQLNRAAVVENKPGATGAIGARAVLTADPDGHTLLMAPSSVLAMNPAMNEVNYNVSKDLKPVGMITAVEVVLIASVGSGIKSMEELLERAKKDPGKITYGSNGIGSAFHMAGALLGQLADIEMLHVPYKGGADSEAALLGNQIDIIAANTVTAGPHIKAGRMIPLAVLSSTGKSNYFPDVPLGSATVPNFEVDTWLALYAPAGTPDEAINKLNQELNGYLNDPRTVESLNSRGMHPKPGSPEELKNFQSKELEKWKNLIQSMRAKGRL